MLIFDLECDSLLKEVTRIHTLCIFDDTTRKISRYDKQAVPEGLKRLEQSDCICGHNIINFDVPVIQKLYPQWQCPEDVRDTLVWARLVCGNIKETDYDRFNKGRLPGSLIGSQSLEAWGYRLGVLKGDYCKKENAWEQWTPEMSRYCEQDVKVTMRLYAHLDSFQVSQEAFQLEHQVAAIISRQERRGIKYNREKSRKLYEALLLERAKAAAELQLLPPFYLHGPEFTPKKDCSKHGYFEGAPMCKLKLEEFNPNSRIHIALLLYRLHGWKPQEWNEKNHSKLLFEICGWATAPTISEEILDSLPYPEAKTISRYMTICKRLSQIVEGDGAWEKYVTKEGCIHGAVNPNGAVTGRMTHFSPNLAQVPASYSPWGAECRELFEARPGFKLVGCDASGLEARILAHFLAYYDGGAYVKTVTEGRKEDKTDVHNLTLKALGSICKNRDVAKTFLYAFLYGAGPGKLAKTLECSPQQAKKAMQQFLKAFPALKQLKEDLVKAMKKREGYLLGIDKRLLYVRTEYSSLNVICQSAGALVMKKALVLLDETLQRTLGLVPGVDYEFVLNVHDEVGLEVLDKQALSGEWLPEVVAKAARESIVKAGEHFKLRCPLDGEYKIGSNWKETH